MAPVSLNQTMTLNPSNHESNTTPYSDTITNVVFGLCALAVGIITIRQGRVAYKARHSLQRRSNVNEGGLKFAMFNEALKANDDT